MQQLPTIEVETEWYKGKYVLKQSAVKLVQSLNREEEYESKNKEIMVPEWFDKWYKSQKCKDYTDEYIVTLLSPGYYHHTYVSYSKHNTQFNKEEWLYIQEHFKDLVLAIFNGYTVEKEPRYYVVDKQGNVLLWRTSKGVRKTNAEVTLHHYDNWTLALTEEEIKGFDENYWAFAVEAEEENPNGKAQS